MRCEEVRTILEEQPTVEFSPSVRQHLEVCPACAAYAKDWQLVSVGFRELSREPVPEASWGLSARVLRRIAEATAQPEPQLDFLEQVGKRFVYATLTLTLTLLLALMLPSSGPLREPAAVDLYLVQPEAVSARADFALGEEFPSLQDAMPLNFTNGGGRGEQ
jgi:hypothetical protein